MGEKTKGCFNGPHFLYVYLILFIFGVSTESWVLNHGIGKQIKTMTIGSQLAINFTVMGTHILKYQKQVHKRYIINFVWLRHHSFHINDVDNDDDDDDDGNDDDDDDDDF